MPLKVREAVNLFLLRSGVRHKMNNVHTVPPGRQLRSRELRYQTSELVTTRVEMKPWTMLASVPDIGLEGINVTLLSPPSLALTLDFHNF